MQLPTYSSYAAASTYIDSVLGELSTEYNGSSNTSSNGYSKPLPPYNCSDGDYFANLTGSGGMFSSFDAQLTVNGGNVTNIDFVVQGVLIGWNWTQTNTYFSGSSGCTVGTITWGLEIGNLTIGFIQVYHFSWRISPLACLFSWSQGSGYCN
ncbi:MAG TPA: hypothetical protein VG676_08730 [Chitinophagaceae bacterium]|jgi:hypothetical protein|nr:hypothetical protein [Chitinophagaceae bacterium]